MNKLNVFLVLMLLSLASCREARKTFQNEPQQEVKTENFFTKEGTLSLLNDNKEIKNLDIELALSDFEHQQGLMDRYAMEENQGMLFIFAQPEKKSFWMKNTRIPLDIIYVGTDSIVVNIAKNAPPMQEQGIPTSKAPVKFVLEVNGGMSDKWCVIEGKTKLRWK